MDQKKRKVTIVGAGSVGATFAYALAQSGFADEIAITDMNKNFAEGQRYHRNNRRSKTAAGRNENRPP